MTAIRDYFKNKFDKNGPSYIQGVLRTIDKLPDEDKDLEPLRKEEVLEK